MEQLNQNYPFSVPALAYPVTALEPYIDAHTMHLHNEEHLTGCVNRLNAVLEANASLQELSLAELIAVEEGKDMPPDVCDAVRSNAGGIYNHLFFFNTLRPGTGEIIIGQSVRLRTLLARNFGGIDEFKSKFSEKACSLHGSGFIWLVAVPSTENGKNCSKLKIISTKDTAAPLGENCTPLIGLDVWEHAYYLKYPTRASYTHAFWNVVDWARVSTRLEDFCRQHDCAG